MPAPSNLRLTFHGRIIEHLGIQMYQSPVAAVAELVSNSWDADAENVFITLPQGIGKSEELTVKDDGNGMTFEDCQKRFLNVGLNRRKDNPQEKTVQKQRPILGRKGIGKFAGFGIARIIRIETISKQNGEKTVFELNIDELCSDEYADSSGGEIKIVDYQEPSETRKKDHGTSISLKSLTIKRSIPVIIFSKSMATRFLLCRLSNDFQIKVNDSDLPEDIYSSSDVEYVFPSDWNPDVIPNGVVQDNGWAIECINDKQIRWKFVFFKDPIKDEELRGISVFSNGKLAQKPFFFNITGGISGQHALEYMSGQVQADFVDLLPDDIIATERQRINWEHEYVQALENWGQNRIKLLASLWKKERGEKRLKRIETKVSTFLDRLEKLPRHERKTLNQALEKLGSIETLSDDQFQSLGTAVLQAWEQGRLRGLIAELAGCKEISTDWLLGILTEADVLVALNVAESICTKLEAVRGLRRMIEQHELENAVRNYIAVKPYLLDPQWETFCVEKSLQHILDRAAKESELFEEPDPSGKKRVDLALKSGEHLLVVEFMRPGKKADKDHLNRCREYVLNIQVQIESQTQLGIHKITGLIVADKLDNSPTILKHIKSLQKDEIFTYSWDTLLSQSELRWREYLDIIGERVPNDERLQSLTHIS